MECGGCDAALDVRATMKIMEGDMAGKGGSEFQAEGKRPGMETHLKKKAGIRTIFVNIVPFVVDNIRTRRWHLPRHRVHV